MKRYGLVSLIMLGIFIVTAGVRVNAAQVQGTRHDLSAPAAGGTGPGPIRSGPSGGTSEICVFCHTPHGAAAVTNAPLWNKSFGSSTDPGYQVYSSDVLSQLSYPAAEKPLPSVRAVHLQSRLCLTCHDGTIALGNLANWPSGYNSDIPMSNAGAAITAMPTSAEGYIGIDLRDDHPVAIQYRNDIDMELAASPAAKVRLFSDGTNNYVECTSCHDPHDNTNAPFLVDSNAASGLCTKCHSSKTGYTGSIHETSNIGYQPPDGAGGLPDIGTTVGGVKCMDCHYPHKAAVSNTTNLPAAPYADLTTYPKLGQYLLALQEEMTCYNEKNRWGQTVSACHGSGGSGKDIKTEVEPAGGIRHRVKNYIGKHEAAEQRDTTKPGNAKYNWLNLGGSWHVECDDCHNSHTAMNTNHITSGRGTNAVGASSPLNGAGGVSVSIWPTWVGGTGSYTYIEPEGLITTGASTLQSEYQICFKCHSDFAWGSNIPPAASTAGFGNLTNQALEFGPNSTSFHPVAQVTGRNAGTLGGAIGGAWTLSGTKTMYCSDCHTKEGDVAPRGPHGSSAAGSGRFILSYPFSDARGTAWPGGTAQNGGDLCLLQCHDQATYLTPSLAGPAGTGFKLNTGMNLHASHAWRAQGPGSTMTPIANPISYKCVNCHMRVPHGGWRRGMVIVNGEGATYGPQYEATGGGYINTLNMPGAPGGYTYPGGVGANLNNNCTTANGCHQ